MACDFLGISSDQGCGEGNGGIYASYIAERSTIALTVASSKITAVTGSLKKYVYHSDNTANYNQTGNRPTENTHIYQQAAFMKFSNTTIAALQADKLKDCCELIAIHLFNDGQVRIQGIEYTTSARTAVKKSFKAAKATVNNLSDVGGAESRVEITINSEARYNVIGDETVLTEQYLDALI